MEKVALRKASSQAKMEYPAELTVVFFYNLRLDIVATIVVLIAEGTSSAWSVDPNVALVPIICSGLLFGSCLKLVHTWALRLKGPVFVVIFKPSSIAIAAAMGAMFLGDTLRLRRLIGATIISCGFYTVMWGKAKEEIGKDFEIGSSPEASSFS